jgi:predicted PurR-regulated permease PerM
VTDVPDTVTPETVASDGASPNGSTPDSPSSEVTEKTADGVRTRPPRLREYFLPLMTLATLGALLINFRTILLPFILACLLVYLMEPLVSRMGRTEESPRGLPRWLAVLTVYIVSLSAVAAFLVAIVPRFVSEFVKLGESMPELVKVLRTEELPKIDERVDELVGQYLPTLRNVDVTATASSHVLAARRAAGTAAVAFGHAHTRVDRAADLKLEHRELVAEDGTQTLEFSASVVRSPTNFTVSQALDGGQWRFVLNQAPSFRLVPDQKGGLQVYMNNVEIEVEKREDRWVVRRTSDDSLPSLPAPPARRLSLQKNVDDMLQGFVEDSASQIGNLIELARALALGIVEGFLAIMLTLMVAAFISIDLYRVKRFFRGLVPEDGRVGFDRFLVMADRGMAGVIRGQLMICLVNGVLTYIGLAILGVKFSLLLAVLAGILSLIPVFGTVLSTVPIVVIGLTDGFSTGVLALGWILLIHFFEANFLNPKIIGQSAHIHPVIVIFALLAGESAYGLVGALLAVPTASLLLTVFNFVRLRAWRPEENLQDVPV